MLRLSCKTQKYAWGKLGNQSIVGRIASSNSGEEEENKEFDETPFAELWMGDHVNGPSKIAELSADSSAWLDEPDFVSAHQGQLVDLSKLLSLNQGKFLGPGYSDKYPHAGASLAFLFNVLSVRTALSI